MGRTTPPSPARRLRFALIVLISQLLLIALSLAWAVHMILVAANGSVYFVESNQLVLWLEISVTVLICLFGIAVFAMQLRRLGERRNSDSHGRDRHD
jgi:hypothetical protein